MIAIMSLAQSHAHSLAPPEYPNSELIESWQSGGSDSMWDRRTYRTSDSIEQVLVFMEKHMPGFQINDDSKRGNVYQNYAEDKSWLGTKAAKMACTSFYCIEEEAWLYLYPGVSVTIFEEPEHPSNTLIQVWISWPAL